MNRVLGVNDGWNERRQHLLIGPSRRPIENGGVFGRVLCGRGSLIVSSHPTNFVTCRECVGVARVLDLRLPKGVKLS